MKLKRSRYCLLPYNLPSGSSAKGLSKNYVMLG